MCRIVTKFETNEHRQGNCIMLNVSLVHDLLLYAMSSSYMFTCRRNCDLSSSHFIKNIVFECYEHLQHSEDQISLKKSNILEETEQDQSSKIPTKEKYNQIWLCGAKRNTRITELTGTRQTYFEKINGDNFFPIKYDLHFLHNWCSTRYSICDILFYFYNSQSKRLFAGYKSKTQRS